MRPQRFIVLAVLSALAMLSAPVAGAQTPPLPALQKPFETAIREAQQQQRDQQKVLNEQYLAVLATAEQRMQGRGAEPGVTWVRAERQRFAASGTLPADALASPSPLRDAQEAWQQKTQAARLEAARRIAQLTGDYLQQLAKLQLDIAVNGTPAELEAVKNESERVLANGAIREALALAKTAPEPAAAAPTPPPAAADKPPRPAASPAASGDYKFYAPGREPAVKDLKALRLEYPNAAARSAASLFSVGAGVFADKEKVGGDRQNAGAFAYRRESDITRTQARLTVGARGRDLAAGARLAVHYFSHPANALADFREERVELIPLPALARGQTVVVDSAGISLGKVEHRGTFSRVKAGDEFYGLIVSLFDADGRLLSQQCSSTALVKSCPAALPAEKTQEPLRGRFGNRGGGPP